MDYYYVSPFACLLYMGIESTILIIIYNIIYSLIYYKDFSIIINIFNLSNKIIYFLLFLELILGTVYGVIQILIIYYFSPLLLMVTDIISPILQFTIKIILKEKEEKLDILDKILIYIGYFIITICALIYSEIIICNFCDLNRNTYKNIKERQKEELALLQKIENDNDSEDANN